MKRFVELSHSLQDGMQAYPGLPSPKIGALFTHQESRSRYEGKAECYIGKVELTCNVGAYLDSPFHRSPNGADLSQIPLEDVAGLQGIVLEGTASSTRAVSLDRSETDLKGKAALVRTGWDARWGTESYWQPGPFLSDESIDLLARAKPKLVGVDFWNVDDTANPARPAPTWLLAAGILIVEHLCDLVDLPRSGFRFYAVPLRIVRGASFPVRAFAEIEE